MQRRAFLGAAGGALLAGTPKLTIRSVEIAVVKVNHRGNWVLVRLQTNEGPTGIGDASHANDAATVKQIHALMELLKGRSPFEVQWFRREAAARSPMDRVNVVAMSGIEQAMWDLQGKALGVSCHTLFGGALANSIPHYANINRCTVDRTPKGFAANAQRAIDAGFTAIKLAPFDGIAKVGTPKFQEGVDLGVACIEAVRKTVGDRNEVLVDAHSNFNVPTGIELARRLESQRLYWLEEVTPPAGLPEIDRAAKMKTAGGESIFGLTKFREYMEAKSVDIVMPDVKYCGGMLELKKVSALAESYGIPVSPHGPASPIGNAAAAQVSATLPNFLILKLGFGEVPWRAELVNPPEQFEKGATTLTDRPGLGIELNDKIARQYSA